MQYDYICHHGTQGMKWGRRLYQNSDGSLTPLGRMRYGSGNGKGTIKTKDGRIIPTSLTKTNSSTVLIKNSTSTEEKQNYSAKARAKNIDEMTDQELQAYNNRVRLEQEYKRLTTVPEEKKKVSAGRQFVQDVAYQAGKRVATDLATQGLNYIGATTLNNITGKKIFNTKVQEDKKKKDDD